MARPQFLDPLYGHAILDSMNDPDSEALDWRFILLLIALAALVFLFDLPVL
jgi:hypothetical protein